jgi:hypothetical protein
MKMKFLVRIPCVLDPTSEQFNNEVMRAGAEMMACGAEPFLRS